MKFTPIAAALFAVLLAGTAVPAAEVTINMVNKDASGNAMQFEPAFVKIAAGDTVHFVAVDKGHDTETLAGGLPDGADGWRGKISQNLDVTLTVPGLYAFKCAPHFPMGMVGLIQVGDAPSNVDAIKALKLPSKATARLAELIAQ
jgi:pseudoazurin